MPRTVQPPSTSVLVQKAMRATVAPQSSVPKSKATSPKSNASASKKASKRVKETEFYYCQEQTDIIRADADSLIRRVHQYHTAQKLKSGTVDNKDGKSRSNPSLTERLKHALKHDHCVVCVAPLHFQSKRITAHPTLPLHSLCFAYLVRAWRAKDSITLKALEFHLTKRCVECRESLAVVHCDPHFWGGSSLWSLPRKGGPEVFRSIHLHCAVGTSWRLRWTDDESFFAACGNCRLPSAQTSRKDDEWKSLPKSSVPNPLQDCTVPDNAAAAAALVQTGAVQEAQEEEEQDTTAQVVKQPPLTDIDLLVATDPRTPEEIRLATAVLLQEVERNRLQELKLKASQELKVKASLPVTGHSVEKQAEQQAEKPAEHQAEKQPKALKQVQKEEQEQEVDIYSLSPKQEADLLRQSDPRSLSPQAKELLATTVASALPPVESLLTSMTGPSVSGHSVAMSSSEMEAEFNRVNAGNEPKPPAGGLGLTGESRGTMVRPLAMTGVDLANLPQLPIALPAVTELPVALMDAAPLPLQTLGVVQVVANAALPVPLRSSKRRRTQTGATAAVALETDDEIAHKMAQDLKRRSCRKTARPVLYSPSAAAH